MKLYLLIITFFFALSAQALDSIPVYSPDSPPYAINMEKGEGMLFDFVNSLNEQFKGKYYFTANFVTRARLKVIFAKKENTMIVPFVNPHWFDDELEKKYFWTLSMAEDCNVIVVKKNKISKIKKWNDLQGMSTSILNGQVNTGVQKIMDQMKIKVEGATHIQLNFLKLEKGRIDFLVTGYSVASYFTKNKNFSSLAIIDNPIDNFNRRILISSKKNRSQGLLIKQAISQMIKSGKIEKLYKKYDLSSSPGICHKRLFPSN